MLCFKNPPLLVQDQYLSAGTVRKLQSRWIPFTMNHSRAKSDSHWVRWIHRNITTGRACQVFNACLIWMLYIILLHRLKMLHSLFRTTSFCLSSISSDRLYAVTAFSVWLSPSRICPRSLCAGANPSLTDKNPATYLTIVCRWIKYICPRLLYIRKCTWAILRITLLIKLDQIWSNTTKR